jgi:hypothetical protein
MLKLLKTNSFWIFLATILILFSFTIFSNWVLMVGVWFTLFFIFRSSGLEAKLAKKQRQLYLITVLLYPLAETGIKWMIVKDVIPGTWFWLNRLEHFSWALATVILFLPLFTNVWQQLNWWQNLIFIIGLICIIGNLNEFLEYFIRLNLHLTDEKHFAAYYWDTIYDMMVNRGGGFMGFFVLQRNTQLA